MNNEKSNNNNNKNVDTQGNKQAESVQEPEGIRCPISGQIFNKPMIIPETGNTYEEDYINKIIADANRKKNIPKDPCNNVEFKSQLILNRTLMTIIESFLNDHKELRNEQYKIGSIHNRTEVEDQADLAFEQAAAQQYNNDVRLIQTNISRHDQEDNNESYRPSFLSSIGTTSTLFQPTRELSARLPTAALVIGNPLYEHKNDLETSFFQKVCLIASNTEIQKQFIKALLGPYPERSSDFVTHRHENNQYQIWDIYPNTWDRESSLMSTTESRICSALAKIQLRQTTMILFFGDIDEVNAWLKYFGHLVVPPDVFSRLVQITTLDGRPMLHDIGSYPSMEASINFPIATENANLHLNYESLHEFHVSLLSDLSQVYNCLAPAISSDENNNNTNRKRNCNMM